MWQVLIQTFPHHPCPQSKPGPSSSIFADEETEGLKGLGYTSGYRRCDSGLDLSVGGDLPRLPCSSVEL